MVLRHHIQAYFIPLALIAANMAARGEVAADNTGPASALVVKTPVDMANLLGFWDFQEESGAPKVSKGKYQYPLHEMNGPIKRVEDGIFGPYSADLELGQWLRAKRADVPGLNLGGQPREISMVAWVKFESDRYWQFIAGIWSEGDRAFQGKASGTGKRYPARQYALFAFGNSENDYTTYVRTPVKHRAMGYLSPFGGASPNRPFAFDYASGAVQLQMHRWYMIAFTYDKQWIKVYVDGKLDANGNSNPFKFEGPVFDGGPDGADFTVALRNHPKWPDYPEGRPDHDEGFDGRIGGLAVFDRALAADEIKTLCEATAKQ